MNSVQEIYEKIKEKEMSYFRYVSKKGHVRVKSLFELKDKTLIIYYQDESESIIKLDDEVLKNNDAVKVQFKEEGNRILLEFLDKRGQYDCLFSFEK